MSLWFDRTNKRMFVLNVQENVFVYKKNFLVAAINLEVSVSISGFALILFLSYRTIIIWVFFYSYWMSELFRNGKKFWKVCESVSHEWLCGYWTDFCDWYLIKSGSFCLNADCMLRQSSFYFDSSDQIFLTAVLWSSLATIPS